MIFFAFKLKFTIFAGVKEKGQVDRTAACRQEHSCRRAAYTPCTHGHRDFRRRPADEGHTVSNIRFERTEKGNIHFLATIDGREVKHVFTPKKKEWQAILDAGFNRMSNQQKMMLAEEYLLGKIR